MKDEWNDCPNCLTKAHTASLSYRSDRCSACGGSFKGRERGKPQLDSNTRKIIQKNGGMYGDIMQVPNSASYILWCEDGIIRFDESRGFVWDSPLNSRVSDLQIIGKEIWINPHTPSPQRINLDTGKAIK